MKRLIASLICIGLITSSMVMAIMSPKRLWDCAIGKKCTESEQKTARAWLIGGSVAMIAAALTAFGIIQGPEIIRKAKIEAIDNEIRDIRITKGRAQVDNISPAEFAKLISREEELHQKRSELTK